MDKQNPDITAFEAIFKRKPNLSHLKVFVCDAYVHIPYPKRTVEGKGAKGKKLLRDRVTHQRPIRYQALALEMQLEPICCADAAKFPEWIEAMMDEMQSHKRNNTWILVRRLSHTKVMDHRWIFKIKRNPDHSVSRFKARLVIRGYRQRDIMIRVFRCFG
jgi:hypothetical protein